MAVAKRLFCIQECFGRKAWAGALCKTSNPHIMAARFCKIACSHASRRLGRLGLTVTEADAPQRLAGSFFSGTFDNFQLPVTGLSRHFSTCFHSAIKQASFLIARNTWPPSPRCQDGNAAVQVLSQHGGTSLEWRRCLRTEGLREVAVKHLEGELQGECSLYSGTSKIRKKMET